MDAQLTEELILETLKRVRDPELDHNIVELGLIREIDIDEGVVSVAIEPTSTYCPYSEEIVRRVKEALSRLDGVTLVEVSWGGT
jgi:ATP-binding protein involved in chromosome partitioning